MPDGPPGGAELFLVVLAFVAGALLKGVTGLGLPPVVLPVLAPLVGIEHAVAVLALPTVVGNGWLAWSNRGARAQTPWLWLLAGTAAVGGVAGAVVLTSAPERAIAVALVALVAAMLAVRFLRPAWRVSAAVARAGSGPIGLAGGALQGATGMSGPLLATWVNALGLPRDAFVLTTSLVLQLAAATQAVTLLVLGALRGDRLWQTVLASAVVVALLPAGQRLGRRLPQVWFDRLVLLVLLGSALGLLSEAL